MVALGHLLVLSHQMGARAQEFSILQALRLFGHAVVLGEVFSSDAFEILIVFDCLLLFNATATAIIVRYLIVVYHLVLLSPVRLRVHFAVVKLPADVVNILRVNHLLVRLRGIKHFGLASHFPPAMMAAMAFSIVMAVQTSITDNFAKRSLLANGSVQIPTLDKTEKVIGRGHLGHILLHVMGVDGPLVGVVHDLVSAPVSASAVPRHHGPVQNAVNVSSDVLIFQMSLLMRLEVFNGVTDHLWIVLDQDTSIGKYHLPLYPLFSILRRFGLYLAGCEILLVMFGNVGLNRMMAMVMVIGTAMFPVTEAAASGLL